MRETAAAQALLAMWIGLEGRAGGPGKDPEFKLHDDAAQGNRGDDRNISRQGKCQFEKKIASRIGQSHETSVFETGGSTPIDLGPSAEAINGHWFGICANRGTCCVILPSGPKQTVSTRSIMSALRGKTNIGVCARDVCT